MKIGHAHVEQCTSRQLCDIAVDIRSWNTQIIMVTCEDNKMMRFLSALLQHKSDLADTTYWGWLATKHDCHGGGWTAAGTSADMQAVAVMEADIERTRNEPEVPLEDHKDNCFWVVEATLREGINGDRGHSLIRASKRHFEKLVQVVYCVDDQVPGVGTVFAAEATLNRPICGHSVYTAAVVDGSGQHRGGGGLHGHHRGGGGLHETDEAVDATIEEFVDFLRDHTVSFVGGRFPEHFITKFMPCMRTLMTANICAMDRHVDIDASYFVGELILIALGPAPSH